MVDLAIKAPQSSMLRMIDWVEKTVILVLFMSLVARMGPTLAQHPFNALLLISDGLVVGLMMTRRRTEAVSQAPMDWLLAFSATALPLLAIGGGTALVADWFGYGLMGLGVFVSLYAKAVLWRSFGLVAANRGVKVTGPYRLVRHPMYLGYILTQVGFMLLYPIWSNVGIYAGAFALQLLRMRAEESLLSQDPSYAAYMKTTRFRLIPGLY